MTTSDLLKTRIELETLITRREALLANNRKTNDPDHLYGEKEFFEIENEMLELVSRFDPEPTNCSRCGCELRNGECQDYGCRIHG
jgi:predicted glycosyltransferase